MKLIILNIALLSGLCIAETKIIYGQDNRIDVSEVKNLQVRKLSQAIAGRVANFKINQTFNGSGKDIVNFSGIRTLKDPMTYNLCSDEKFANQPLLSDCTGFLVGDDLLVTAGHCITDYNTDVEDKVTSDCENYSWVFDFKKNGKKGVSLKNVSPDNVYKCKRVIKAAYLDLDLAANHEDYAVIQLDRKVVGRTPLKLRGKGNIRKNTKLYVIGHPSGLPMKFADGARVFEIFDTYFATNLDTFGGNSGSPVFNAVTNRVEGILVRGDTDYTASTKDGEFCLRVNTCDDNRENCQEEDPAILGEHVSIISKVLPFLK
ncbi:MAG: hypothetical protein CME62_03325 [Halobacteriovoraceae bacterium]|nr:hypothetical protein [Halobacteriovoraceae bacterium]|tara:strand:+ start:15841 stop:16791 length:951 start_codon:yes stop_codon:yes gene_type:complete